MLQIAQGLKTYEITNENGLVVGSITLNPTDAGMAARADDAKKTLKAVVEEMKNTQDKVESFRLADRKIRDCFDYIFGCEISAVVFKNISALALTESGEFVFENILEALLPLVKETMKTAQENSKKKVGNYVQRYIQPAHKG